MSPEPCGALDRGLGISGPQSGRNPQSEIRNPQSEVRNSESVRACSRYILIPPDIVAVKRTSPVRVKKRTPWHPRPEGDITERAGARDWFSDRLFVEAQDGHMRAGYGTSITVHVVCAIVLIAFLLARPVRTLFVDASPSLVMPALTSIVPVAESLSPASRPVESSSPKPAAGAPAAAPAPAPGVTPAAPVEAPSGITPETGSESGGDGVEGGVAGGIIGGLPGGAFSSGPSSTGPLRAGGGIKAPRKIKHVKPEYPQGALPDQARGTVIVEATIGIDGKVKDARVLQSIPSLDQAALEAVRQWEYEPSLLNGVAVAVIMTIIVNFAIQ